MANRLYKQFQGTLEAGVVFLYGTAVTSTSGTLSSTSCKGFTLTKVGGKTGRYLLTLADKYTGLLSASAIVEGAADAAYGAATGCIPILRSVSVGSATPTLTVQFITHTGADAEVADGAKLYLSLTLKNSSAY